MARKVDPVRHEARRLQIIDAGMTVFAARGYDGATTSAICRQAGIGSGTFFHYFPTKLALLLAILALGTAEVRGKAEAFTGRDDPLGVLLDMVRGHADDVADPRIPGFVRSVATVMHIPDVARALEEDIEAQRSLILPWVVRGQDAGEIRRDLTPERITSWLVLLTDGFLERVAVQEDFTAAGERDLLVETAELFLRAGARPRR